MKRSAVFALLALSGCAQVLGLGDFVDDDPSAGGGGATPSSTGSTPSTTSSQMSNTSSGMGGDVQGGGGNGTGGMGPDPGDVLWAHGWGATVVETAFDVDVTSAGDVYVSGVTPDNGTFSIGSTMVTGPAFFLVKLDAGGVLAWARAYPISGDGNDWMYPYGIDATDQGVALGLFLESPASIDFGGGFPPRNGVVVARIGPDGSTQWTKSCGGGTNYKASYGGDIAMDAAGDIVVASLTNSPVNCAASGTGASGPVVSKLNASGGFVWDRGDGFGYDGSIRIALDSAGNVLVAGEANTHNWGGTDVNGAFAAKLSANGGFIWSKQLTPSGGVMPAAIAATATDEILIGGRFFNDTDFGGGTLTPAGTHDAFLVRLATNGNHQQSAQYGNGQASIEGIERLPGGDVLITGWFAGSMPMGGDNLMAQGMGDGFVARVSSAFEPNFARRYGGAGNDRLHEVALGPGFVAVAGDYDAAIDFGAVDLQAFGNFDAMVLGIVAP